MCCKSEPRHWRYSASEQSSTTEVASHSGTSAPGAAAAQQNAGVERRLCVPLAMHEVLGNFSGRSVRTVVFLASLCGGVQLRWYPIGYCGTHGNPDKVKRDGWHDESVLAVSVRDHRLARYSVRSLQVASPTPRGPSCRAWRRSARSCWPARRRRCYSDRSRRSDVAPACPLRCRACATRRDRTSRRGSRRDRAALRWPRLASRPRRRSCPA